MLTNIELQDIAISVKNGTLKRDLARDPKLMELAIMYIESAFGDECEGDIHSLGERVTELEDDDELDELRARLRNAEARLEKLEKSPAA